MKGTEAIFKSWLSDPLYQCLFKIWKIFVGFLDRQEKFIKTLLRILLSTLVKDSHAVGRDHIKQGKLLIIDDILQFKFELCEIFIIDCVFEVGHFLLYPWQIDTPFQHRQDN